jgi:hypothetical protein
MATLAKSSPPVSSAAPPPQDHIPCPCERVAPLLALDAARRPLLHLWERAGHVSSIFALLVEDYARLPAPTPEAEHLRARMLAVLWSCQAAMDQQICSSDDFPPHLVTALHQEAASALTEVSACAHG